MADPVNSLFGSRVLRARTARGWSVRDLAARSGVSSSTVSRAERGGDCTLSHAARMAAALGAPLGDLLADPACPECWDRPPPGFTCNACGQRSESGETT